MQAFEISIPREIANLQLPKPELLEFYQNLHDRVIWLDADVDESCIDIAKYIIRINKEDFGKPIEDRTPIKLLLFSYGGDADINSFLIDVIKLSKTPIWGYNMGLCASAACFIFLATHKRYGMPSCRFLIHKGSAENLSGTYDQIVAYVMEYQKSIADLAKYILDNTKIDKKTLGKYISTEWYISAEDALNKYGMLDGIVKTLDEVVGQ